MNKEQSAQRIGQRIAALRKMKGMTQADLANLAGVQRQHIGRIENGELVSVAYVTIQQIAEALGMTCDIIDPALADLAPLKRMTPPVKGALGEAVESKSTVAFNITGLLQREMKERMERNGNDLDKVAAEMGISKRTLNRKLKKLGLL